MKEIKLNSLRATSINHAKYVAFVDDEDFDAIKNLTFNILKNKTVFYARSTKPYKGNRLLHRIILGAKESEIVDHINHDGLDCRKENLRKCTCSENGKNKRSKKNSTSQYLGVHLSNKKRGSKVYRYWVAQIVYQGKKVYLGQFNKEIDAARAYDSKAKELHREFANLNFK